MQQLTAQALLRIDRLISAMTLAEKTGQLTMTAAEDIVTGPTRGGGLVAGIRDGTAGSVLNVVGREGTPAAAAAHELQRIALEESRLGIPLIIALDVTHGYRTLFPVSLGEAALFDEARWEMTAREAAAEAAAAGVSMTFAPMLDVSRDPRWGRIVEGAGEDPLVGARLAAAKVRGFQGDLASATQVAAVAKHYLGYGAVTAGREYASVDVSRRTLLEVHLPPFAAAVRAGVAAVMPGFHDLAGEPMTVSRHWLAEELRGRLGFDGVIVSDYNAIGELLAHGVAGSLAEAAALALSAGVDIDMMAGAYLGGLPEALARGTVTMGQVDAAVRRVLVLKTRLGLFDDPYARGREPEDAAARARRRLCARQVAARSLVLLTHRNEALPLPAGPGPLCVLGPLADAAAQMRGPWWAASPPGEAVSVLAALRSLPGGLRHAEGVGIDSQDTSGIPQALALAAGARAVLLCLGEAATMSGEAASRAHLSLPGAQRALAEAVLDQARNTGTPVIAVLFSGRPLVVPWLMERADAVLAAFFPGSEAGTAIADVLTGRESPGGRLPVSWPQAVGQVPVFFAQRPSGRPPGSGPYTSRYLDAPNEPQFAFGHGLTYGRCVLSNLVVTPGEARQEDTLTVTVEVLNEGPRSAGETVFVFTRDVHASIARPLLELMTWGHITLGPQERGRLTMSFPASQLAFLGPDLTGVFEPGEIEVRVGPSAQAGGLLMQRVRLLPPGAP